jgi:hypothetical protein
MGRAGIEPATHGFSVPKESHSSPQEPRLCSIKVRRDSPEDKNNLCRTQVDNLRIQKGWSTHVLHVSTVHSSAVVFSTAGSAITTPVRRIDAPLFFRLVIEALRRRGKPRSQRPMRILIIVGPTPNRHPDLYRIIAGGVLVMGLP